METEERAILRLLVTPDRAGEDTYAESEFADRTCLYCKAEEGNTRQGDPPFSHLPTCPIRRGRELLGIEAS